MLFSSGNSGFSKIFQWKRKKYYITMEIIMIQLKNVPTGGKPDGEVRIEAENTTQYLTAR